jgi:hypothetical protein
MNTATSSESSFDIGSCITGELRLKILNKNGFYDPYSFDKAQVNASVYSILSGNSIDAGKFYNHPSDIVDAGDVANMENVTQIYDGQNFTTQYVEQIRKGTFQVDEQSFNSGIVTLVCYDRMIDFDTDYIGGELTMSASAWVDYLAGNHNIVVKNSRFNNSTLQLTAPTDQKYTEKQILNYVLQCTGNYARIDENGYLCIEWYDVERLVNLNTIDAGTYTNPSEDIIDAGNGADIDDKETIYSGGEYADRQNECFINHYFSHTVDIDDVTITGIRTTVDDTEYLAGDEGYVLKLEKNPFITADNQADITTRIWETCKGLTFRPMTLSILNNPLIQAGDLFQAEIKGRTYTGFATYVSYTQGAYTQIKCAAASPTKNSQTLATKSSITEKKVGQIVDTQMSAYDVGMQQLVNLMSQSMGLYVTTETQDDGSKIFYMHNKSTLSGSTNIWKMTGSGFTVSSNGGKTWSSGWDAYGNVVMNTLSVVGIKFDWAKGGTLTLGGSGNGNGTLNLLNASGTSVATMNSGGVTVNSGTMTSVKIKTATINDTSDNFYVTSAGYCHMSDGDVGGFSINSSSLTSKYGSTNLYSSSVSSSTLSASSSVSANSTVVNSSGTQSGGSTNSVLSSSGVGLKASGSDIIPVGSPTLGSNGSTWTEMYADYVWAGSKGLQVGGSGSAAINGNLTVGGTKNRVVETSSYGKKLFYSYETATPYFGDIGDGVIGEDGKCYISIDDIFSESVEADTTYQVFLQAYGKGECYVSQRDRTYFVVEGTPNLSFGWEVKAVQRDYALERLETFKEIEPTTTAEDVLKQYVAELDDSFKVDNYNADVSELMAECSPIPLMDELLEEIDDNDVLAVADQLYDEASA